MAANPAVIEESKEMPIEKSLEKAVIGSLEAPFVSGCLENSQPKPEAKQRRVGMSMSMPMSENDAVRQEANDSQHLLGAS